jgi:hypothetical protein
VPNLLRCEGRATAGVHAQNQCVDVIIVGQLEDVGNNILGSNAGVAGVGDVATGIVNGYFVLALFGVGNVGRCQIVGVFNDVQVVILLYVCKVFELVLNLVDVLEAVNNLGLYQALRTVERNQ